MPFSTWFASGGIVMYPLLGFTVLATALILERSLFWFRITHDQDRLVRDILTLYRRHPSSAFQKVERNLELPMARIFFAALELEQATPEEFRLALESAAQAELPLLKRFNTLFETIISVSPLVGLLGTILSLIHSFGSLPLGEVGGNNPMEIPVGIGEALISTASGLAIAILTLLFANTFRGLYLRQMALIQEYGGQLELLYRRHYERSKVPYAST